MSSGTPSSRPDGAHRASAFTRYRRTLWLLSKRDLKVRYSTSFLGYLWSILDPLLMAGIYFVVFTVIFQRAAGDDPYIVFLLVGLLPWTWFNGAISDSTTAYSKEARLIRSTTIPRSIWIARIVLSKGIEFLLSIPVVVLFIIGSTVTGHPVTLSWGLALIPVAIVVQAALAFGIGLIIAPLVVFFRDLERATKLLLRVGFYATPIVYGLPDLAGTGLDHWAAMNPLAGIIGMYRAGLFPDQLDLVSVSASVGITAAVLIIGALVYRRTLRSVLKEL